MGPTNWSLNARSDGYRTPPRSHRPPTHLRQLDLSSTGADATGRDLYLLNIAESGALYLHTTGRTDVVGTLYGPDGKQIAMDDNSGEGDNFRIATNVEAGLYLLEVKGTDRR